MDSVEGNRNYPITLHVYDVIPSLNRRLGLLGLGFYHTGIQVHNVEYMYWGHNDDSSGIVFGIPHKCYGSKGLVLRKSIVVGHTPFYHNEVLQFLEVLNEWYSGRSYDLFTRNGNHFVDDFGYFLGARKTSWTNHVVNLGFLSKYLLPVAKLRTRLIKEKLPREVTATSIIDAAQDDNKTLFTCPFCTYRA